MKLSASTFKNFDYKQFFINHGEKVAIAVVALLIGSVLMGSNWKATDKSPQELIDKAKKTQQVIEEHGWPDSEKRALGQGNDLGTKVVQLLSPVSSSSFGIQAFNSPLHPDRTQILMPKWLPVEHLIAEYGVADLQMKPGIEPLNEGFVRNKPKEKESRAAKAHQERLKRLQQKFDKMEPKKPEIDEENLPEDLKPKEGAQGGKFGGRLLPGAEKRIEKKGTHGEDEPVIPGRPAPKASTVKKNNSRGYRFVAVRGVFPLMNQVRELARAMGLSTNQKNLLGMVQLHDFKLQRQTRVERSGADPWSGAWEDVDRDPVIQLLENDVAGYAPETVLDGLLDSHICMPYPERMFGLWGKYATHPDIKEFSLTDEEIEQQVEYEWKLIEKLQKEGKKSKAPPDKGGFSGVTQDLRAISPSQAADGDQSIRDKVLLELASGDNDRDKLSDQLAEFVRTRATPVDHYLLFRYLDIKVEPGKTYRYRAKLVLANPFHDRHIEEVADPSIIEKEERDTAWSDPTPPVTVKEDAQFFVKRVENHVGRTYLPSAEMDIFQWFAETGTVVNSPLPIQIGQILGGRTRAEVLRPAEEVFEKEKVLFSTKDALVDVAQGFPIDAVLHQDVLDASNVGSKKPAARSVPSEAVVVDENGELRLLDGLEQKADYDQTRSHYELQNKTFEDLKKSD